MKKSLWKIIIPVFLAIICVVGCLWFDSVYIILNGRIYERASTEVVISGDALPKTNILTEFQNMEVLDVRQISVEPQQYELMQNALPDCRIIWNVPFVNGFHNNESTHIAVTMLLQEDLKNIVYFFDLETIDGRGCREYDLLTELKAMHPELDVIYTVTIGDREYRENTQELQLKNGEEAQLLNMLSYLPDLKSVNAVGCTDYVSLAQIYSARPAINLQYQIPVGGESFAGNSSQITVNTADIPALGDAIPLFPYLTDVTVTGLTEDKESVYQLMCDFPDIKFHWSFEIFGVETDSDAKTLILSNIKMENTEEVENSLKYFYHLERVEMCECGISSEEMDALGKRHPEIRFVWTISIGVGKLRTDATAFIPYKIGYDINHPLNDSQVQELKYCIDMECLDLGHMRMTDVSFLNYMPKLRFLILADIIVEDFSPIVNLTELVYLELFWSQLDDVNMLMNMKKLECLNIGWTELKNPELLKEMTWLKRLWVARVGTTYKELQEIKSALPDTYVYIDSMHPTEGGWRNCDRYYEMRDLLGMFYME